MTEDMKKLKELTSDLLRKDKEVSSLHQQKDLLLEMLLLLNETTKYEDAIVVLLKLIKDYTGVEAAAVRLKRGDDYPYYVLKGFPEEFIKLENFICSLDKSNNKIYYGNIAKLDCMCGCVVRQSIKHGQDPFTTGGSFYTGDASMLFERVSEWMHALPENTHIRGVCGNFGYNTIALIPLKAHDEVVGVLQLNDKRKNAISQDVVEFFERASNSIGVALNKIHICEGAFNQEPCNLK